MPTAAAGRAVPRPARIEEGFRWTDRCRAREHDGGRARRGRSATPACACGEKRVTAVHLRVRTRLGGDVRGAYTMDSWLRRTDGLLLRRTFGSDSRVDAIIGAVPAHEEYELKLRSLTPVD